MSKPAPTPQEDQFNLLRSRANLEKERQKEPHYKSLFLDLLQQHRGILLSASTSTSKHDNGNVNLQDYQAETKILKKVMEVEREALIGALTVGTLAFLTVRYLPHTAVRIIGGKAKYQALQRAEAQSRKNSSLLKKMGGILFEGSFGFWAAYRGYHMAVDLRAENIYEDIVALPLVEGRSIVSDSICDEWEDIVRYKVSNDFWRHLDLNKNDGEAARSGASRFIGSGEGLKNEEFFRGVLKFHDSCRKRKAMEDAIRRRKDTASVSAATGEASNKTSVAIPAPGVPENILELSEEEIQALLD